MTTPHQLEGFQEIDMEVQGLVIFVLWFLFSIIAAICFGWVGVAWVTGGAVLACFAVGINDALT